VGQVEKEKEIYPASINEKNLETSALYLPPSLFFSVDSTLSAGGGDGGGD